MSEKTSLGYIYEVQEQFENYFNTKVDPEEIAKVTIDDKKQYVLFLSIGSPKTRARVFNVVHSEFEKALYNLMQKTINLIRKNHLDCEWVKLDVVTDMKKTTFAELEQKAANTRKNYFRSGIAFDPKFRLAFLEQEINGNAMIRSVNKSPLHLHERNINQYLKRNKYEGLPFMKKRYQQKDVYLFQTFGVFSDKENPELKKLYNGTLTNGIRKVDNIEQEAKELVEKSTYFLTNQVASDGQFEYGYFSAFARRIGTYNILRHSSTLYSMAEGYELLQDETIIKTVERGIDYLIREAMVYKDETEAPTAFIVDKANHNEMKLGASATAILAMTKYMELTESHQYLEEAQALARGILQMKTISGKYLHVLTYPSFEIKAIHRIIYYEGEATFALLRLYALDQKEVWLNEAKQTFEYFISNDYWKYHDHWLSYAANEITIYDPDDKYFIFGLKNCNARLDFIYHRETTYPTFLELMMAAYKTVEKIKQLGKHELLEHVDEAYLAQTIDKRAEYQRVGFFYPELAMYMKNPGLILNSFFVRHHSFRVRIDDIEHYLSGYCQFLQHRIPQRKYLDYTLANV